ncbi:glycerophosphodiester phosphodiesterase GDPDL4-like isoform X2 [Glycine soja]|uniref:glycerophosphodiester phosphodiesterase GDPDL4 isoform X2 n=1 Tax=Glycine max TaxID=3847 RepID=UPI0003DED6A8|nr:glycerophosphodiester phosphodiesterase GDPDL4 isoform X2 [Glycine max]XP_028246047.1 glycerophosphodiester phosphodiesterase GDPDL4-like isoform X2 [Glycine soja]|eukprot:XP_006586115.1 glycerophosphodiester phosphodiesterase GDPDL4 isoform X3 [Glycine max]
MLKPRAFPNAFSLLLLLLHSLLALVSARGSHRTTWNTLTGSPPLVIARGGSSGIFPDSSEYAYELAAQISLKNLIVWCDVQLTKDGEGICISNIKLENATDIDKIFENRSKTYSVNGVQTSAYFAVDYTLTELRSNVLLIQGDFARNPNFDDNFEILTVNEMITITPASGPWLNIQYDAFYAQHNLSMKNFVLSVSRTVNVSYISSPEAGFLRSIKAHINPRITKVVFRFLEKDEVDPSTNRTYGSLLKNLASIKTFASGILVPKGYIWPVDPTGLYLLPHTSLVSDAHKVGLEVFASDILNDIPISYNYSYDPVAEYLNFIDNGNFSVDGVLSDFPLTPSEAIDCFAHIGLNSPKKASMLNPYSTSSLYRNPKSNKKGQFLTLLDFLNLTKAQTSLLGVVIIIENAAYLARKQNLSVTEAVIDTLSKAGYDKPGAPKVMIQSTNSSVLLKFKEKTKYELVYKIDEIIRDAVDSAISDIKRFAHSVVVKKASVYPDRKQFVTGSTKIVPKFKSSNLTVYVETFSNEFVSQAWDFMSDATVEINTFVKDAGIDGVITDFPKTANRYRRNRCLNLGDRKPPYMKPVQLPGLLSKIDNFSLPPALAPVPPLTEAEVTEPPLPPLSKIAPSSPIAGTEPGAQPPRNAQAKVTVVFLLSTLTTVLVGSLLL